MFSQALESAITFIRLIFLTFFIFLNERIVSWRKSFHHPTVLLLTDISRDFGFRSWLLRVIDQIFLSTFQTFVYHKLRLLHKRFRPLHKLATSFHLTVTCVFSLGFVRSLWNGRWVFVHLHLFWRLFDQRSSLWSKLHQAKVFLDNYFDLALSVNFQSLGVYVTDKILISYKIFV